MKKVLFGIFAHPDDEAFGPGGTFIKERAEGAAIHLICLTTGQMGQNPDSVPDLGAVRLIEWQTAGKLMGAATMHNFELQDGSLNNRQMIDVATRIEELVRATIQHYQENIAIEFVTMDTNGITGHIDHIVAARAALLAFYRLKQADDRFVRVRLACIAASDEPSSNTDWLYMDQGRRQDEIDETVDASDHLDTIINVMRAHHSQRGDGETHIARGNAIAINHFIVLK